MKKSTTAALFLSPVFLLIVVSQLWIYWLSPKIKEFVLLQIPKINLTQPYVLISVEDLKISILKLQAQVSGLELQFKPDSPSNLKRLKPIKIKNIKAQVDLFSLIVGQLSLSNITIDQLTSNQDLETLLKLIPQKTDNKPELIELANMFKQLSEIPVQKINIQNSQVAVHLDQSQHPYLREFKLNIDTLMVTQKNNALSFQVKNLDTLIINKNKVSAVLSVF